MTAADDQLFGAEHVRAYRESSGKRGYHWHGATILLLTTRGRTSENPSWFANLRADPQATIQVRGETIPVRAQAAAGAERDRLWSLMAEVWPAYDDYQARTEREIPVVVLTRR